MDRALKSLGALPVLASLLATSLCACGGSNGGSGTGGGAGFGGTLGTGGSSGNGPPGCQTTGGEVRVTNAAGASTGPRIVNDGGGYAIAWSDARTGTAGPYALKLNPGGTPAGSETPLDTTALPSRTIGFSNTGSGFLTVWEQVSGNASVHAIPLNGDAQPAGPSALIDQSGNPEARPVLLSALSNVYVAWMKAAGGSVAVSIGRVGSNGQLSGTPASLGADTQFGALASDGSKLAVAYVHAQKDIKLAVFDANLNRQSDWALDSSSANAYNPSVAWSGSHWVVAWEDTREGGSAERVYVTRADASGNPEPSRKLQQVSGSGNWPQLTPIGNDAVAATFHAYPDGAKGQIFLTVIGSNGQTVGSEITLSNSSKGARFASLAYNGQANQLGVVWQDTRFGDPEVMFAGAHCGG